MKIHGFLIAALFAVLSLSSCKTEYELLLEGNDIEAKYAAAFDNFNQGKYSKAARLFESLATQVTSTEIEDTVNYYWGLSNYRFRDYYTAETNFNSFIVSFPMSPFAQDARYYRIDCLYRSTLRYELDQKPTQAAVSAINQYIKEYQDSPYRVICDNMLITLDERLCKKAFENARLYYKMEDYLAATVALRNVLKDNSENIYREDVLYYIAMSSYKYASMSIPEKQKERYLTFVDDYLNFVGEYPESHYRNELNGLYRRAQRYLGKSTSLVLGEEDEQGSDENNG